MNSLQNNALTFHSTTFSYMEMGGQVWLTAAEVGQALGYTDDKAIHRLYRKHADEFTVNMTGVVKVTTPGGMQDSRVFSLRGAHLMGMFSRTTVAKEFRRWVLDILDREATQSPIASRLTDDDIVSFCYLQIWMEKAQQVSKEIYPAIKQLGSEYSGIMYDLGNESRFVIKPTREILMREIQSLDMGKVKSRNAEGMLRHFVNTKELH